MYKHVTQMWQKHTARILPRNLTEIDSNLLKVTQEFRLTKRWVGGRGSCVAGLKHSLIMLKIADKSP